MFDALDSNEQGIDSRCGAAVAMLAGEIEWSLNVFLRQGVESNAIKPLSQPMVTVCPQENAGYNGCT